MRSARTEHDVTAVTELPTRTFHRTTKRSAGSGKYVIRIVDSAGHPEMSIHCNNIDQCRDVIRVESPLYEPGAMFFIADGGRSVETWAIGKDGMPKRGKR